MKDLAETFKQTSEATPATVMHISTFSWGTLCILYIGLTLSAGKDGINLHYRTAMSGIAEIPGYFCGIVMISCLGRKNTAGLLLLSCGLSLCLILPLQNYSHLVVLVLTTCEKMSASAGFAIFSVFSSELLPTSLRSSAFENIKTIARLLGSICPFIILTGSFVPNLHYLIFGFLAFLVGGLVLLILPVTSGRPLPQNIDDLLEML